MKKLMSLILILALTVPALTGCRRKAAETPEATATPAPAAGPGYTVSGDDQPSVPDPLATLTPQERAAITVGGNSDVTDDMLLPPGGDQPQAEESYAPPAAGDEPLDTYDEAAEAARQDVPAPIHSTSLQYSALTDENVDFTFNYPSEWENVPGIYTVCFREKVEKGQFPARVAVSRKKLVHTPDEIVMNEQMTSYLKSIAKQYDADTFQIGTVSKEETFIRRKAVSNTYLAYWGSVEVKGYVIGVAVDRTLYVFHFCASYSDYAELESVMQYMVSTVQLYDDPKDRKKKR